LQVEASVDGEVDEFESSPEQAASTSEAQTIALASSGLPSLMKQGIVVVVRRKAVDWRMRPAQTAASIPVKVGAYYNSLM
jgi:hypothetical protein